jgi:DNA-3-methyladenine glycosylase I
MTRCGWVDLEDPLYVQYHDDEWGVPLRDDRALFELLALESFQAGLSWRTILHKREAFRKAFDGFDPRVISKYREAKVLKLMANAGIIRNRAKIDATVGNAARMLEVTVEFGSFGAYLWGFVDGTPIVNRPPDRESLPASTERSDSLSRDLKARGFKFVGSTTCYAFMQASGMVDDHVMGCFRAS